MTNDLTKLAEFIHELEIKKVPKKVAQETSLHIYNLITIALKASCDKQIQNIIQTYSQTTSDTNSGEIWGHKKTSLFQAIFMNALMGHTLELDDVHVKSKTHIGTVVIPSAWTLAKYLNVSGKELVQAVICGYEVMARVGLAFNVSEHRNLGWHVSSTAGVFGSAAACAKLLKLNKTQTLHALALSGAQSFGTWAFLSSNTTSKVLNPARAAQSGCEAAFLAKAKMRGAKSIFTSCDGGLFTSMTKNPIPEELDRDLGVTWELLKMDNKPYPSCRSTHFAIDCALSLKKKHKISYESIEKIDIKTYLVGYKQCATSQGSLKPTTPIEAKFSLPYTVLRAFLEGKVTLEHFQKEKIKEKQIQKMLSKVKVVVDKKFTARYPNHWGGSVSIFCKDGSVYSCEAKDAKGSTNNPLSASFIKKRGLGFLEDVFKEKALHVNDKILNIYKAKKLPSLI